MLDFILIDLIVNQETHNKIKCPKVETQNRKL